MKELDTNKNYDLRALTDTQLLKFAEMTNKFKNSSQEDFRDLEWLSDFKSEHPFELTSGDGDAGFAEYSDFSNSVDARTLFIENNEYFTFINLILEIFEEKLYHYSGKYSQFTIDYIQNNIIDLDYTLLSEEEFLVEMIYDIGNILEVIKDGVDKDLFIDLKSSLEV